VRSIGLGMRGHCETTIRNFMLPCGEKLANLKANTSHKLSLLVLTYDHKYILVNCVIIYWLLICVNKKFAMQTSLYKLIIIYWLCCILFFKFPVFVSHCIRIVLYTFFSLLSHHHCFSNCILNSVVQSFDIFGTMFLTT
jgi:hypothetical protein